MRIAVAALLAIILAGAGLALVPAGSNAMLVRGDIQIHQSSVNVDFKSSSQVTLTFTGYANISAYGVSTTFQNCNVTLSANCTRGFATTIEPSHVQFDPATNPMTPPYMVNFTVKVIATSDFEGDAQTPAVLTVSGDVTPAPGFLPQPMSDDTANIVLPGTHGISLSQVSVPTIPQGGSGAVQFRVTSDGNVDESVAFRLEASDAMEAAGIDAAAPGAITVPSGGSATAQARVDVGADSPIGIYTMTIVTSSSNPDTNGKRLTLDFRVSRSSAPDDGDGVPDGGDGSNGGGDGSDGGNDTAPDASGGASSRSRPNLFENPLVLVIAIVVIIIVIIALVFAYRTTPGGPVKV